MVAVGIILCGRKAIGVTNIWNHKIEELTHYTWEQVKDVFEMLAK